MDHTERIILVIESDTAELRRLREILTREGYSIMTASDPQTAMQLSKRISFDFVLAGAAMLGFSPEQSR